MCHIKHLQNINKVSLINQSAYRRSARIPSLVSPTEKVSEATKQLPIVYNIFFFFQSKEITVMNIIKYSQHQYYIQYRTASSGLLSLKFFQIQHIKVDSSLHIHNRNM